MLHDGWLTTTQFGSGSDCWVNFVHTVWFGTKVGVYVDGSICGPIKVAYDFGAKRAIPFNEIEKEMRASIIADYSVTAEELRENGGDVFKWAAYPGDGKPRRSRFEFELRQNKKH